jgi:lysophospholipase L1-like esterase
MKTLHRSALLLVAFALTAGAALAQSGFALKDGDRVVFYGDSITEQRLYTTYAETFVLTRFPKLDVAFVHSGWGGDRVNGGGGGPIDVRLWRDVLAYNPSVVTIMLGMNDGRYRPFDQQIFDEYATGYKRIIQTLKRQAPGLRITALQPSAYDDVTRPPAPEGSYNATLVRYSEFLKELAGTEKLSLADLNTPVVAALTKAKEIDAAAAARLISDRIHPAAGIQVVMAGALLKGWNAPAIVTDVEIDAQRREVRRQQNTRVSELARNGAIAWVQTDEALPMALTPPAGARDNTFALALRSSDFVEALDRQPLKVTGLAAGKYSLRIDGAEVGVFGSEQLAAGINLAELPTPMTRQAAAVHELTLRHNTMHSTRWRQVQVPMEKDLSPAVLKALVALDDVEADLVRQQRATAQPQPRRYELIPN